MSYFKIISLILTTTFLNFLIFFLFIKEKKFCGIVKPRMYMYMYIFKKKKSNLQNFIILKDDSSMYRIGLR